MKIINYIFKGGTQQISQKLLDNVLENNSNKIIFNAELVEIKQDDNVEVKVKDTTTGSFKTFTAKKCVSAIPINLLEKVDFTPALPLYKTNVFNSSRMGNYGKCIITYKTTFWRTHGFSGEVVSDGSIIHLKSNEANKEMPKIGPITCIFDATTLDNHPALVVFLAGDTLVQWFGNILYY